MQPNELRIGNITDSGIVYEIHENHFYVKDEEGVSLKSTTSEIKPIPITEECMFRFGFYDSAHLVFKPIGEGYSICYNKHKKTLYVSNPMGEGFSRIENAAVHQLQNLHFSLTLQELKINL